MGFVSDTFLKTVCVFQLRRSFLVVDFTFQSISSSFWCNFDSVQFEVSVQFQVFSSCSALVWARRLSSILWFEFSYFVLLYFCTDFC